MIQSILDLFQNVLANKGTQIKNMLLTSFRILGDGEVKSLLTARILFTTLCYALCAFSIVSINCHYHPVLGWFSLLLIILVLWPYSYFFHVKKRACITWIAYAKLTNRSNALAEAKKIVRAQKWRLRSFALIEIALKKGNSSESSDNQNSFSITQMFMAGSLDALSGIFEIAESFLMPAIVIDNATFKDASQKLRQLRENIPAALSGSFGLDIFGGLASGILSFVYIGIIIIGIALALTLPKVLPYNFSIHMHSTHSNAMLAIFVLPILSAVLLIMLISRIIRILVTSLQAIYFSIFYTSVNHASEISADKNGDIL